MDSSAAENAGGNSSGDYSIGDEEQLYVPVPPVESNWSSHKFVQLPASTKATVQLLSEAAENAQKIHPSPSPPAQHHSYNL